MSNVASLAAVARRFNFVREQGGPNRGFFVNFFQRKGGDGVEGDSWCADFICVVADIAYKGKMPIPRTGSCQVILDHCRRKGYVVPTPQVDDLYFFVNDAGHAHHIGAITDPKDWPKHYLDGIAGNTSEDGTSSNGDGVYEHDLKVQPKHLVFARLPK